MDFHRNSRNHQKTLKNTQKARKYPQNPVQIFAPHELTDTFFEPPDFYPSPAIPLGSIVYGKITPSDRGSDLKHLKRI